MVTIKNLFKDARKPGLRSVKIPILKDINLTIPDNQIVSIIGPNGAGKSTTIKIVMDFVKPTSGTVEVQSGVKIGYLPENPYYYDYLTLRELLWFSARTFKVDKASSSTMINEAAARVGMSDHLNKRLRTFSKGMTQRAGIAAAIVHDPDLIILDEPMSGLDPLGRRMVFNLIQELKGSGKTILFCSHILSDVERLCDEVAIMHRGEVHRKLTREDLLRAQKQTEFVLQRNNDTSLLLQMDDLDCRVSGEFISLFVSAGEINKALDFLNQKRIEILSIKSSEVTLEKIFEEVTRGQKEGEVCGPSL